MSDLLTRLKAALGDRYDIERELGSGGMAIVYLAEDVKHHRKVAVKVVRPELAEAVGAERFVREIDISAQLHHPHILTLIDSGEADGLLYYVMPYVEGESLRSKLARQGELPVPEALRVLREVVDALAYAHKHGIVHRDIKPDNVLLADNHAFVMDFGVAKAVTDAAQVADLTSTGMALGTPTYMSPEQAAADPNVDHRADLYAIGVLGYEMLTGRPPFAGATPQQVLSAHVTQVPDPPTKHRSSIPPEVERTVLKCLEKRAADRWQTSSELLTQIDALATPSGGTARVSVPARRPRRGLLVAVAALGIAAVVFAAGMLRGGGSAVLPSASSIAVIPFAPTGSDTALARLGRDLVVTLSANLDGVGEIRTIDASLVLARAGEDVGPQSVEDGAELARNLGASSLIHGSLLRTGADVLLNLGLFESSDATPLARTSVRASPDDLIALTDSATRAILREMWTTGESPTPSLAAALSTQSLPALRAFLEGERAVAEGRWLTARPAYQRAIDADSTFWLAYQRYARASSWILQGVDTSISNAYRNNRFELPERERLLIEVDMSDSRSERLERLRAITDRYPDFWPAWLSYGDRIIHSDRYLGYTIDDARTAFERVAALNPHFIPAWEHLAFVAGVENDAVAFSSAIDSLTRLGAGPLMKEGYGFDMMLILRYGEHAVSGRGIDPLLADSIVDANLRSVASGHLPPAFFAGVAPHYSGKGAAAAQLDYSERLLKSNPGPALANAVRHANIMTWASRGAWDSAMVAAETLVRVSTDTLAALHAFRAAAAGTWLGAVDESTTLKLREAAARSAAQLGPWAGAEIAWLDGVLAFAREDADGVAASRRAVNAVATPSAGILDSSLAALALGLAGNRRAAGEQLAALELGRADIHPYRFGNEHPYFPSVTRLTAASWLVSENDAAGARRLLEWHEAIINQPAQSSTLWSVSSAAYLQRGRVEEQLGNRDRARKFYQKFLDRYDLPDPNQQHLVEEAKTALARLSGLRETR